MVGIRGAGARHRWIAGTSGILVLVASFVGLGATPASAVVFSSPTNIAIPLVGDATPYPDTISVTGLTDVIADVNVTLFDVSHTYPDDVDVLLVGPGGQDVVLMADVGGGNGVSLLDLSFDDGASALPDSTAIASGTYRPTQGSLSDGSNCCGFAGLAPSGPPFGSTLSVFNGTSPNGTWSLYVVDDDGSSASGSIASGWRLEITMAVPTITGFAPTSGPPGTPVIITGTHLTGVTSVTFGGVPTTGIFNNTSTSVTAAVPQGAITGPITVTTPNGSATSVTDFIVIPPPTITSFSPTSGRVGEAVVIAGTAFTGAVAVRFNGITAAFTVDSPTQITTTVPLGATTGKLAVSTGVGTGRSSANFVVEHERDTTLQFQTGKAKGNVAVIDGFVDCVDAVPVKLQAFRNGRWKTIRSGVSKDAGAYNLGAVIREGKYRTLAPDVTTTSGDRCLKDVSAPVRL